MFMFARYSYISKTPIQLLGDYIGILEINKFANIIFIRKTNSHRRV